MKKLMLSIGLVAATFTFTTAQIYVVTESSQTMSLGANNALSVSIGGVDMKLVEKKLASFFKTYGKGKADTKTGQTFIDNATMKNVSANPVDIYLKPVSEATGVTVHSWFDLGGAYLSSKTHPSEYATVAKLLEEFAIEVKKTAITEELETQEKELGKRTKELEKLISTNKKLYEDIEAYKSKILEAEEAIKKNYADQVTKNKEIEVQKSAIETTKGKIEKVGKAE